MKNMFEYRGYWGSKDYSEVDDIFYGKLMFIRSLVSYEAETESDLESAFRDAVDDYLVMCETENIVPEAPFQSALRVNVGERLHRKLAFLAAEKGIQIDSLVEEALVNYVGDV